MAVFRFLIVNEDGTRVGRFETSKPDWRAGDLFDIEGNSWRIIEVLPEVSTMVAYNGVWIAAPKVEEDELDEATQRVSGHSHAIH